MADSRSGRSSNRGSMSPGHHSPRGGGSESDDARSSVEFVTPPQSDDGQESANNVNMEQLLLGDALQDMDEEAQEGLCNIPKADLQMDIMQQDEDAGDSTRKGRQNGEIQGLREQGDHTGEESKVKTRQDRHKTDNGASQRNPEEAKRSQGFLGSGSQSEDDEHSLLSEEVETNVEVLYRVKAGEGEETDTRVLQFSSMFLPDTDKRRKQMEMFNRTIMQDVPAIEDEKGRKRKRDLKDAYKRSIAAQSHKSHFLPINPFLEDFYFLQGHSKLGVPPSANKKAQPPSGYKPLFTQSKLDHHHSQFLDRISKNGSLGSKRPLQKHAQIEARSSLQVAQGADKAAEQASQNDFALDACQINELKSDILEPKKQPTDQAPSGAQDPETILRKRLRSARTQLQSTLARKLPRDKSNKVEQQSFALLTSLSKVYNAGGNPRTTQAKKVQLPSEVDMYETLISEKFKQAGIAQKRVKYWGELKDCVSSYQASRDANSIKQKEWHDYKKGKLVVRQPVFAMITPAAHQGDSKDQTKGMAGRPGGPHLVGGAPAQVPINAQLRPIGAAHNPTADQQLMAQNAVKQAQSQASAANAQARQNRRTAPLETEKSDFALVTSFEEYEKLKKQEGMFYQQRKRTQVTAASIMRHVRWKLGKISDKDFYREEYQQMRREELLEDKQKMLRQAMPQRRPGTSTATSSLHTAETTASEPKDIESEKKVRSVPVDFEENLDKHFDRKRVEIQERILRQKSEKERASQQKQNTTQTPAYEPMPVDMKESEADQNGSENANKEQSDNESSSSDSDSDSEDGAGVAKQGGAGHTMLPSMADELNHAECIKDLSFFKLNWQEEDLARFHRPDLLNFFEDRSPNGRLEAQAVSARKGEKETRLNPHLYFKTRAKLSLAKGKFCVFEHIDQHPLFVNNFGMASRLKRYFYGDKAPSKKDFLNQKSENASNRHIGPYGSLVLKRPLEKLDLLGQVDRTRYNGITLLENNMYNAPVFYHRVPSTSNDFLCSVVKQGSGGDSRIVIRSFNSFFTVGQIEPKREVYNPQSRHFTHFIKTQSKAYTTRLLQENKKMYFNDIRQFFPQIGSPILKKGLKEIEVDIDRNHECRLNANFELERHKDRMTPEMICQFESARHGQHRLEKIGVSEILSADKISYSTHKFCFEETNLILQRVAKLIESEVLQTPWNLSSNYIKIKQEASMMMLEGQGDPSYGYGGYSFLKMPLKISADSIQGAKANRMNLNPAIQNPKAVTGTEADLRKLKKRQLFDILLEVVPEAELQTKTRWEMVAMLRSFASRQMPSGQTMKSFYARGVRNTSRKQQEKYNERANSTFRKQMDMLSDQNPRELHELSEEEPDFVRLPDLDAMGLEQIGQGFGTSLTKPRDRDSQGKQLVQTKRDPGKNAEDFTRDIYTLVNDESRKQIVEIERMPDIKRIEDIKDYLKLFLVIHPNALSPQNSNPSGINIGGVSSNAEFLYAMNGNGSKEWEKKLLEKLQSREISKKCEILCHKIRTMGRDDSPDKKDPAIQELLEGAAGKEDDEYERVIFCADEKAIKKFKRCMNKNQQRQPRRANRRTMARTQTRPLTDANLKLQAARIKQSKSTVRSGSRSITSMSINRGVGASSASKSKILKSVDKVAEDQQLPGRVKLEVTQRQQQVSPQKSKKSKRKPPQAVQSTAPALRFNITFNGVVPQQRPSQPMAATEHQQQQPKPVQIVALAGPEIPSSQPTAVEQAPTLVSLNFQEASVPMSQPIATAAAVDPVSELEPEAAVASANEEQAMVSEQGSEGAPDEDSKSNNLVNNEDVSNLASDYEPDTLGGGNESSDFDYGEDGSAGALLGGKGLSRKQSIKAPSLNRGKLSQASFSGMQQISLKNQKSLGSKSRSRKKESAQAKFKPLGFSNNDFEYQNPTANKSRRRQQQDGTQSLNSIFIGIIDSLLASENSFIFHNQPTRQEVPNYREIIKQPIALKDMKNRAKRNEYKDSASFEADVDLMVHNAEVFNGPGNYIAGLARDLQELARQQIDLKRGFIENMECIIKMDGAGQI